MLEAGSNAFCRPVSSMLKDACTCTRVAFLLEGFPVKKAAFRRGLKGHARNWPYHGRSCVHTSAEGEAAGNGKGHQ